MLGLAGDARLDGQGAAIEDFDLPDNLMLAGAVATSGGTWVSRVARPGEELAAFEAFEDCLRALKAVARAWTSQTAIAG